MESGLAGRRELCSDDVVVTIREAVADDIRPLQDFDPIVQRGNAGRRIAIQNWVTAGAARVAEIDSRPVGYCVVEDAFFGQEFVEMLVVAEAARRQGVGSLLLMDADDRRSTAKLFTSTNLSNQAMQRLLARLGWQSAGILYGLDEDDPELFFIAPSRSQTFRRKARY